MKQETRNLGVFFWVAAFWWALSAAVLWKLSPPSESARRLLALSGIWLLCVADLAALAKLVLALLELTSQGSTEEPNEAKKHRQAVIRASSWGAIKLACLAFIGLVLLRGREIPTLALLAGLGTLIVVPIFGGLAWHLRGERHA